MTALPHLFLADSLRAVTICLWGVLLAQSITTLWYAMKVRKLYLRLRVHAKGYRLMWWHILAITLVFDSMATEISWKIIFNGVGKVGISMWTYPNVAMYLVANIGLYLIVQIERKRYIRARLYVAQEIKDDECEE